MSAKAKKNRTGTYIVLLAIGLLFVFGVCYFVLFYHNGISNNINPSEAKTETGDGESVENNAPEIAYDSQEIEEVISTAEEASEEPDGQTAQDDIETPAETSNEKAVAPQKEEPVAKETPAKPASNEPTAKATQKSNDQEKVLYKTIVALSRDDYNQISTAGIEDASLRGKIESYNSDVAKLNDLYNKGYGGQHEDVIKVKNELKATKKRLEHDIDAKLKSIK